MKLALQDETELNLMEPELAVGDEIFSDQDLEKEEPLLYDLQHIFGIDAVELEDEMPALKMENQMNPKDYKVWKNLPVAEKSRLLRQIRSTAEYKEFIQACAMLAATKGYEAVKSIRQVVKRNQETARTCRRGGRKLLKICLQKLHPSRIRKPVVKYLLKRQKRLLKKAVNRRSEKPSWSPQKQSGS